MAKNRKNQSAAIRFGPALKASFLCLLIGGSAVGYVWQKNEIYRLGQQIRQRETRLAQLSRDNEKQSDQLAILHSPVMLDQRARELKLGLGPAQPSQIVRLGEAVEVTENKNQSRQFAERPVVATTQ
jgi:cell division protein FtsB